MENIYKTITKTPVIILCGGKGERLKAASSNMPKVLVDVDGKPFIRILMDDLLQYGFKHFILCVGYLKEQVQEYFAETHYHVEFSEENKPLGTGGALKRAASLIKSSSFLVVNGDSMCRTDYAELFNFHYAKDGLLTVVLVRPQQGRDCGVVNIDSNQQITNFMEKVESGGMGFINAGIYLMQRGLVRHMPQEKRFSLEYDFFPNIIDLGCYGFVTDGDLIDIGTPKRLSRARKYFAG